MKLFLDLVRGEKEKELASIESILADSPVLSRSVLPFGAFSEAIKRSEGEGIKVIGEIKPSSPSTKNFSHTAEFDLKAFLSSYQEGGVSAFSVLTDKTHFGGGYDLLAEVSQLSGMPILQKEFVISPIQMKMGKYSGASAVLLLTHYFSAEELKKMIALAEEIGLEPVVEVSVEEELPRAIEANPKILLINNRPISKLPENASGSYLQGSVGVSRELWCKREELRNWKSQENRRLISASCYKTSADLEVINDLPYDAILVGNLLSSSTNPKDVLLKLTRSNT